MGFSDLQNVKQQTKFSHLFLFKSLITVLNNKIDVVIWADHNFSTKPYIETLSVDSNSTGLKPH